MAEILLNTNASKVIALDDGAENYYPASGIDPVSADVYWHFSNEDPRAARFLGTIAIGETITVPFTPRTDAEVVIRRVPVAPDGLRAVSDLRDAQATTISIEPPPTVSTYDQDFGDGFTTTFTITHNLGSTSVSASFWDYSGLSWFAVDANTIEISQSPAPTSNHVTVVRY